MIGADRHPAGVRGDVVDAVRLAHVIRYLDDAYAIDTDAQAWARQVADALRGAIHEVNTTRVDDQATPDAGLLTRLRRRFDQGVAVGISTNLSRPWPKGNHPGLQLAKRLKRKAHQVWLFTTRLDVPPRTTLPRTTARSPRSAGSNSPPRSKAAGAPRPPCSGIAGSGPTWSAPATTDADPSTPSAMP